MRAFVTVVESRLNPAHWPISRKVAVGPVIVIALLGLVAVFGWSIADNHQRLIGQTYKDYAVYGEKAHRLPHALARIQRDLYKLTIWAQLDVQGPEVTSTMMSIDSELSGIEEMLAHLEALGSVDRLKDAIQRYGEGVKQARILIQRSPRVGATATRGLERVYQEADDAANSLAASAEAHFDRRLQDNHQSWQRLIVNFLLMIGAVALLVPMLGWGTDHAIARPVKHLAMVVDRFRQGELDVRVSWTSRRDEIGLVARAMEAFRANLIRNRILERERAELNQELERKVEERTQQLAEQAKRLEKALEKEHELNGLQRQFVSMVCHEFRTPLAIIDGNAQRIIKRVDKMPPDRLVTGLGKVRTSVTRLTELMESVLSASKLEAGAIDMRPAPCDLAGMIVEVANNYREVNPSYRITADVERLPERFTVDVKLIRQVVSNLISNAVKYSPEGSAIRIEAHSCEDGGVTVEVHDQGVGIPAPELEKLFQRFFRASTSTGIAGTGIGLHMVKALVDLHDGRVTVSSDEGVGTVFRVYLPRRDHKPASPGDDVHQAA